MSLIGTVAGLLAALFYGLYAYMTMGDASIYNSMTNNIIISAIVAGIASDVIRSLWGEKEKV